MCSMLGAWCCRWAPGSPFLSGLASAVLYSRSTVGPAPCRASNRCACTRARGRESTTRQGLEPGFHQQGLAATPTGCSDVCVGCGARLGAVPHKGGHSLRLVGWHRYGAWVLCHEFTSALRSGTRSGTSEFAVGPVHRLLRAAQDHRDVTPGHLVPRGGRGVTLRGKPGDCLLYTSPSPRDRQKSRMPSSA